MKILVCLKQVPHQDARLDVRPDGAWIQEDNIKFEINSYDTYALEEALRVKDATQAEVVVVSIGPERVTQALRTALGMGADRAIHVKDPAVDGSDPLGIAKILAAIAKAENPDLIFTGFMSDDGNFAARAADAGGAGGNAARHRGRPGRAQGRHAERLARDRGRRAGSRRADGALPDRRADAASTRSATPRSRASWRPRRSRST